MTDLPADIYAEQEDVDVDALANLGPLAPLAGVWESAKGLDVNPYYEGDRRQPYFERISLELIDPQSNGPQLLYGLRYHTHIVKPGEVETYHDQVGYWLWEPATGAIFHSLTIPRGQIVLAIGHAEADAKTFEVTAQRGSATNGICSGPFLDAAFRTDSFTMKVTINDDGTWSYFEDTVMTVAGRPEPFHHTDRNTLVRVAASAPNPLAAAEEAESPS
ncbi:MAG TPA: heme-binding beta-barrel domain-containing protein [Caulobacteraceae bacterium]|nr:heme-binding beta-barrel domain-containing protein [Caulobacteraceae bacterium]